LEQTLDILKQTIADIRDASRDLTLPELAPTDQQELIHSVKCTKDSLVNGQIRSLDQIHKAMLPVFDSFNYVWVSGYKKRCKQS